MPPCTICHLPKDIDRFDRPMEIAYSGDWSELCQKCRLVAESKLYASFKIWKDLLRRNLMYLREQIDVIPGIYSETSDEYVKANMQELIELHEYGILTREAQPVATWTMWKAGEGWTQGSRRPYLWFLIPTLHMYISIDNVDKLVDAIFAHPELEATVWSDTDEYPDHGTGHSSTGVLPLRNTTMGREETYSFRSNVTATPLAWSRTADTLPELQDKPYDVAKHFDKTQAKHVAGVNLCGSDMAGKRLRIAEFTRPLAVGVVAKCIEPPLDIQIIIKQLCEEAGLSRVFKDVTLIY